MAANTNILPDTLTLADTWTPQARAVGRRGNRVRPTLRAVRA